jgi:endonuclease/exonuclease/phosphatase (EEP) superfamily protein YafD
MQADILMDWLISVLWGLGSLAVVASLLPLLPTTHWWVRIWDFPRFQIALLAVALIVVTSFVHLPVGIFDWLFLGAMAGVVMWQATWVGPYLPVAPRSVRGIRKTASGDNRIRLLTTNVLQNSRGSDKLIEIIRTADPDITLAVEVDEWWAGRLSGGLGGQYPHKIIYPLSNGYGLAIFSRLELIRPKVRFVIDEAIPSIRTRIRLRSGAVVILYGVHPRPPSLLQNSTERDAELVRIALEIKKSDAPSIVLGDLNDVAWSPTTQNFMRLGNLVDPRRGRGFYNTYPARWPGFRYPLDYIFSTRHFAIGSMRVLPAFGSDHLPLVAELHLTE